MNRSLGYNAYKVVGSIILFFLLVLLLRINPIGIVLAQGSIDVPCLPPPNQPVRSLQLVPEIHESAPASIPRGTFFENTIILGLMGNITRACLSSSPNNTLPLQVDDSIQVIITGSSGQTDSWVNDFYNPSTGTIGTLRAQDISRSFPYGSSTYEVRVILRDLKPRSYSSSPIWLLIWENGPATPTATRTNTPLAIATSVPIATPTLTLPTNIEVTYPSEIEIGKTGIVRLVVTGDPTDVHSEGNPPEKVFSVPVPIRRGELTALADRIKVYPRMSAQLIAANLEPKPDSNILKPVTMDSPAAWNWEIKAKELSEQYITLNIYGEQNELIKGMSWKIVVLDKNFWGKITEWFANNLFVILGTGGPLGLFIAYLLYRSSRTNQVLEEKVKNLEKRLGEYEHNGTNKKNRK